jgi:hypothetical protein
MISSSKYFRISKKFNTQTKQKKTDNEIERQIERTKISHNNLSPVEYEKVEPSTSAKLSMTVQRKQL